MIYKFGKRIVFYCTIYVTLISRIYSYKATTDFTCGKPGQNPDSEYYPVERAYKLGDEVRYSCSNGGLISEPFIRRCGKDKRWTGEIPECYKPLSIQNARYSPPLEFQNVAKSIDGDILSCIMTEKTTEAFWEGYVSPAAEMKALRIVFPRGDSVQIEVLIKENETTTFHKNYSRIISLSASDAERSVHIYFPAATIGNLVHIRDLIQGLHNFRICEITAFLPKASNCLKPDLPLNGNGFKISSTQFTKYTYSCDEGYELWGDTEAICQSDGKWSAKQPHCELIYCTMDSLRNGSISPKVDFVLHNGIIHFTCDSGFVLNGSSNSSCIRFRTWSVPHPTCIPISKTYAAAARVSGCTNLPNIANGKLLTNSTEVGSIARLFCDSGYKPLTETAGQCLDNGMWSIESLMCIPLQCEENPVVPHGRAIFLDGSTYLHSRLQIVCNRGNVTGASLIRICDLSETWGDLNVCIERSCRSPKFNESSGGRWLPLNYTIPIWILVCESGYHIEGSAAVTQCLTNGSWSYTNAVCIGTLAANQLRSTNVSLVKAIAAGAGTAIVILCLARIAFVLKRRVQSKGNTTVFHDAIEDSSVYIAGMKENSFVQEHYYTKATYEDIIELRQKSMGRKPRKPRSALPHLPIDTDPVYAQPFENSSALNKKTNTLSSKEDPYTAHIYAEPIDSKIPAISATYIPNCMSEAWFQTGTGKYGRKMSLPNNTPIGKDIEQKEDSQNTVYKTSCHDSALKTTENKMKTMFEKSDFEINNGISLALIENSIYLESDNRDFCSHINLEPLQMTDNDIYREEQFSNV